MGIPSLTSVLSENASQVDLDSEKDEDDEAQNNSGSERTNTYTITFDKNEENDGMKNTTQKSKSVTITYEKLPAYLDYIFVCCHLNRDKRCGVIGPHIVEKMREIMQTAEFRDKMVDTKYGLFQENV